MYEYMLLSPDCVKLDSASIVKPGYPVWARDPKNTTVHQGVPVTEDFWLGLDKYVRGKNSHWISRCTMMVIEA